MGSAVVFNAPVYSGLALVALGAKALAQLQALARGRNTFKGVARIDHLRTHGFQGRVSFKGKTYTKFFSDGVYGNEKGAREAAAQWVFEKEEELGKPHTAVKVYSRSWGRLGESGIFELKTRPGYMVRVTVHGKLQWRYVSWAKRSRQAALLEAIKVRDALMQKRFKR